MGGNIKGTWKSWKTKVGNFLKKVLLYGGIALGSILSILLLYKFVIGLRKKKLLAEIATLEIQQKSFTE